MAHISFMSLQQEKFQDIQDFWDQYMALHKVFTELGLRLSQSKDDVKAVLADEGVTSTSNEQLKEALDWVEEEIHAIVFLYKADKQRYSKFIEEIENDFLQKKNHFQRLCPMSVTYWEKQVWN